MSESQQVGWIYGIHNLVNGKWYVGQTVNRVILRFRQHRGKLRSGSHSSKHLQLSWNKYGEDSFEFVVLEECFVEELDLRESYWIYFNRAKECGYNHRLDPSTNRGYVVSEEQKQRISGAIRSLWLDPVERVRLTKAKIGHVVTDEGRANMSKARCGSVLSAETKRRISESQVGRVASAETRLKMSKSSKRPAAKLTISQVKVIKCRLRRGETAYFIAKSLGLHPSTIYKIKDGANWRGVRV